MISTQNVNLQYLRKLLKIFGIFDFFRCFLSCIRQFPGTRKGKSFLYFFLFKLKPKFLKIRTHSRIGAVLVQCSRWFIFNWPIIATVRFDTHIRSPINRQFIFTIECHGRIESNMVDWCEFGGAKSHTWTWKAIRIFFVENEKKEYISGGNWIE